MNKFKRGIKKLKWIKNDIGFSLGVKNLTIPKAGNRILVYHGVTKDAFTGYNARFISTKNFENQLVYFKKNFNVISLNDFVDSKFSSSKFNIALTFDDGYRNNLREVLPLLNKYKKFLR